MFLSGDVQLCLKENERKGAALCPLPSFYSIEQQTSVDIIPRFLKC